MAAGLRILLERWGAEPGDIARLYLAGAFGNAVNPAAARRIGLIDLPDEVVHPSGNTALRGARLVLFRPDGEDGGYAGLRRRVEHVPLAADPRFQVLFGEAMGFPEG